MRLHWQAWAWVPANPGAPVWLRGACDKECGGLLSLYADHKKECQKLLSQCCKATEAVPTMGFFVVGDGAEVGLPEMNPG